MAEGKAVTGAVSKVREQARSNPATNRLVEELSQYLEAQAERALVGMGHRLGSAASRLAEPGAGGGLIHAAAEGGKKIGHRIAPDKDVIIAGGTAMLKETARKAKDALVKDHGKGEGGAPAGARVLRVIEDIDVGVPVREAYNQWTQFQEFGKFAKGVEAVEQTDDTTADERVKIAKGGRSWRGKITEQIPDKRIAWASEGDKATTNGVITFHPLGENLTKVLLVMEYYPTGLVERTGALLRAQGRRARLDLEAFRSFLMLRGEATGGWRGEIHEGDVVSKDEEEEEEPRGEKEEEEEEEGEEEQGEEEDQEDREQEEEAEAEERPRRRPAARR